MLKLKANIILSDKNLTPQVVEVVNETLKTNSPTPDLKEKLTDFLSGRFGLALLDVDLSADNFEDAAEHEDTFNLIRKVISEVSSQGRRKADRKIRNTDVSLSAYEYQGNNRSRFANSIKVAGLTQRR